MTTTTEHSPFPSDETLAAYVEGTLDEETRERVAEHMAGCPECLEVLLVNGELEARGESDPSLEWNARPVAVHSNWWRNATIGLAAAAAVALVFYLLPRDDLRTLAKAAPPRRPSAVRITGFPYREPAPTMRGKEKEKPFDAATLEFERVAADVRQRAEKHPNAKTLRAAGVADLVLNEHHSAVKNLQSALIAKTGQSDAALALAASNDAAMLSDLAAAYIADGRYREASVAAERAWQLSKTPEIAWNRALAVELQAKNDQLAISYWRDYLEVDQNGDPRWRAEAEGRIAELENLLH